MAETPGAVSVLIADDEPLARMKLKGLLAARSWIGTVSEAGDGPAAIAGIEAERPDLVFLDIRMPGATGLQVVERIEHRPLVIFTTAYDRYAVAAFELQAIDYLLKPFGTDRFERALERARRELQTGRFSESYGNRLRDALTGDGLLNRIFVRAGGRILSVPVSDVERFEASGDYVRLFTSDRDHLLSVRLGYLEARLDPDRFLRIHRSHIVNLDHVTEFRRRPGSRYDVRLRSGTSIVASRTRSREIRRRAL